MRTPVRLSSQLKLGGASIRYLLERVAPDAGNRESLLRAEHW